MSWQQDVAFLVGLNAPLWGAYLVAVLVDELGKRRRGRGTP